MSTAEIFNYRLINERIITAGQPTEEQLHAAAAEGFHAVINLAPIYPNHPVPHEAEVCQTLGLNYHHIPVDWNNPTTEDYARFAAALDSLPEQKLLIHCAANYRVTAFFSAYARHKMGWTQAQAEELINSIWSQDPRYTLNEVWLDFLQAIS